MILSEKVLRAEERAVYKMRELYGSYGYLQYKVSKFEEYDLYAKNKSFLVSDKLLTFTDTNGKLMALKPDVTLSIIKNVVANEKASYKVYYDERVYRTTASGDGFGEIMQTGLECIGRVDIFSECEVVMLAMKSLETISENYVLDVSHMGILGSLFDAMGLTESNKTELISAVGEKNTGVILDLCRSFGVGETLSQKLIDLLNAYGTPAEALPKIRATIVNADMQTAFDELCAVCEQLTSKGYQDNINIDCSVVNDMNYYNGIVFKGFLHNVPVSVLSGGRYDRLMSRVNKNAGAIGFAVYLDEVDRILDKKDEAEQELTADDGYLNVALPKGRLGEKVYAMFEQSGFECPQIHEKNRRLIFENPEKKVRYFWVKPSDVAIYVERGAADIGVAGKDILLEYAPDVYELLDLDMGKCRMCVAGKKEFVDDGTSTLRVATKFTNIAKTYYAEKCRDIDIIKLNGSIEIAPILSLSDVIVDIVETGATLKENGLEPKETIVNISARLISNKASYKFKAETVDKLKDALEIIVREKQ